MDKYCANYLRLSDDDNHTGESNSIAVQRQIIEDYISSDAKLSNMPRVEFVDDGYSGTNFNRPGVKQLLEAVKKGEISCIIVKDLSRFGRQFLEVSKFIEQIFPCLGVRLIAINDHYDSNDYKGISAGLDVPVRNMINAMYSKDISQKIKSAVRTKKLKGENINAFAFFGYKKDEMDIHKLAIDEPAARVVRRIFALADTGLNSFRIANMLNIDKIFTPAVYKSRNGSKLACNKINRGIWTTEMVLRILNDEADIIGLN